MGAEAVEVLVVDDDVDQCAVLVHAVRAERVVATGVHDGLQAVERLDALEAAGAPAPRVIVLDLQMPQMGGRELLAELERRPWLEATSFVVLSASYDPHERFEAAAACLSKPIVLRDFQAVVRRLLSLSAASS
jgi:CheY-like chemotaxis protein